MTQRDDDTPIFSASQLDTCLKVLLAAHRLPADHPKVLAIERAAAGLRKKARKERRASRKKQRSHTDKTLLAQTAQHQRIGLEANIPDTLPDTLGKLHRAQQCYVCHTSYFDVHPVYHRMCSSCSEKNLVLRNVQADLTGRRALITGGRIKIGFHTALKLLRDGASVHVTTRFPNDAARRFAAESDASLWSERLIIHGLDLRNISGVAQLCTTLLEGPPLDILINNAAQTVHRPPAYYKTLAAAELHSTTPLEHTLLAPQHVLTPTASDPLMHFHQSCAALEASDLFPANALDIEGEPLDLRALHSWRLNLADVPPSEVAESWMINTLAPFLLNSQLKPSLLASPWPDRYIVNVSSSEGQFSHTQKTTDHPHTNMAKAALNMMTRTAGEDYAQDGIYMTSVDPGWVTDITPEPTRQRLRQTGFRPPLDAVDCAARIYNPIVQGIENKVYLFGVLLKDYAVCPW